MPRPRKKSRVRRPELEQLDPDQIEHLLHGRPFVVGFGQDREAFEYAWELHGDALTEEFTQEFPGHRPFAWWLLDHEQERPVNPLWPWPEALALARADASRYSFGFLHGDDDLQEPQRDYLARHGLLCEVE